MNRDTLQIHQHNVNHSPATQSLLLQEADPRVTQVIALQEPWINPQNGRTKTKQGYLPILPSSGHPRVAFLISAMLDTTQWDSVPSQSGDLVSIRLQTDQGPILVHNCYNPSGPESHMNPGTLPQVTRALNQGVEEAQAQAQAPSQILLGDFNLHHPRWGGNQTFSYHRMAEELISTTSQAGLLLATEPGTVTWERQGSSCQTLDLVFLTRNLHQRVLSCRSNPEQSHGSDHLPIITTLQVAKLPATPSLPRPQWKKADWEKVNQAVQSRLQALDHVPLRTEQELDQVIARLQDILQQAVKDYIPVAKPSNYAKMSWTQESQRMVKLARKMRRQWSSDRTAENHQAYLATCHARNKQIKKDSNLSWRSTVSEVTQDPRKIWKLAKWAREKADQPHSLVQFPSLQGQDQQVHDTNPRKAEVLAGHFFPPPRQVDLSDMLNTTLPPQFQMEEGITEEDVRAALRRLPANKAPGPDSIPNTMLKKCSDSLSPLLSRIFSACLDIGYHPLPFKESTTVVLRKPQKPDYTKPGAYRPIALLNTMAKTLEAIVARRMSKEAEARGLLPQSQMGARPGRSTTTALDLITEQVQTIWQTHPGAVASMLCLDISGAFDNVSHQRLLHNIRMQGYPNNILKFLQSFLQNRTTRLRLGTFLDKPRPQEIGIPQGSTLSPILFLFFASTLLPTLEAERTTAMGFVDDTNILTYGDSTRSNCRKLEEAHQKCADWAKRHGAAFAPQKYQLIHFTRSRRHDMTATIQITGFQQGPVPSLRLLGVWVDTKLQWGAHIKKAAEKGAYQMQSLQRLCKSTWGASFQKARHIYTAVVRPAITYGCQTWTTPQGIQGHKKGLTQPLERIQNQALRHITGAYKSVPAAVLQREADIPPLSLYTQDLTRNASIRNRDQPAYKFIQERCKEITRQARTRARNLKASKQEQTARLAASQSPIWLKQEWDKAWERRREVRNSRAMPQPVADTSEEGGFKKGLHKGLSRPESTMATLLRTEHIGLRAYLTKRRVPGMSPECQCSQGVQTPKHICMFCPIYQEGRNALFAAAGSNNWKDLTQTRRGLLATTRWLIQEGVLDQFSLAKEEEVQRLRKEGRDSQGGGEGK